jgi:hypothetical protein
MFDFGYILYLRSTNVINKIAQYCVDISISNQNAENAPRIYEQILQPVLCSDLELRRYSALSTVRTVHRGLCLLGTRGSVVVKALCYKPKGRGFDSG